MLQRLSAGIGTYLVGTGAETLGVRVPMLALAGVALVVGALALAWRKAIGRAFVGHGVGAEGPG